MRYCYLLIVVSCLLFSCAPRQLYYVSPFNGNSNSYHAQPLKSDSIKTANYVTGAVYYGSANTNGADEVVSFIGAFYRSHQFGMFQAYYGASIDLGGYEVGKLNVDEPFSTTVNPVIINSFAGNKFFGGYGAEGGINFVLPMGKSEWRLLGIELSTHREFGKYLEFRQKLPDSSATLIVPGNTFSTMGLFSELVKKTQTGSWGFKIASGGILENAYNDLAIYDGDGGNKLKYSYTNFTFQYTRRKWTGYLQGNIYTKASGTAIGAIYHL